MFECTLEQGELFRKIVAAITDLVQDGNFQIDGNHISFQGMDSSHVSLVSLSLQNEGFNHYRCDRELTLGINFASLTKVLKCMGNDDKLSIKCQDNGDSLFLYFENQKNKRMSTFELKLMDIDAEQLGIPDTNYGVSCQIPSVTFSKIIRDLSAIGDSVTISVTKEGIKFSVSGDIGNGEIQLSGNIKKVKKKKNNNKSIKVKKEDNNNETPGNNNNDDEDDDMKDNTVNEDSKIDEDNENEEEEDDEDVVEQAAIDDSDENNVQIVMNDTVSQTFAVRYLLHFTKASTLSKQVTLQMGADVPLMCSYKIDSFGQIGYYLAPKIDDDE